MPALKDFGVQPAFYNRLPWLHFQRYYAADTVHALAAGTDAISYCGADTNELAH
jgi:hypothetical protein